MESPQKTGGQKIPDSEKESLSGCPCCGRSTEGGLSNQEETCPYDDCGKTYTVIIKKKG